MHNLYIIISQRYIDCMFVMLESLADEAWQEDVILFMKEDGV